MDATMRRCQSRDEVQALVRAAREQRWQLYPYATGRNWGYGGSSPVRPGCLRVDLSGMNRILNAGQISVAHPVALIEPGVTQGQLADFLAQHCPQLSFNVTGSARATSLIGNCLDRGVGYLGPRHEDLFGLEVVTGRGELLYTGFRRLGEASPLAQLHPPGLGPNLDGLFAQGNFGIVTSACFRLLPRPERQVAVSLALRDPAQLAAFVDALVALRREGVLRSVTHIGNRARTESTLGAGIEQYLARRCGLRGAALARAAAQALSVTVLGEWTALAGLSGSAGQVRAGLAALRDRLRGLARVLVVTTPRLDKVQGLMEAFGWLPAARARAAAVDAVRPLHGLAIGQPSDVAIDNLLWRFGQPELPAQDFEASRCGIVYISPALPLDGRFVQQFLAELQALAAQHQQRLYTTLNIEGPLSLVAVCNLLFDRAEPGAEASALACAEAMEALIAARGLSVYRARTDMMERLVNADDPYWQQLQALKQLFDPDGVIAPGRYNLS